MDLSEDMDFLCGALECVTQGIKITNLSSEDDEPPKKKAKKAKRSDGEEEEERVVELPRPKPFDLDCLHKHTLQWAKVPDEHQPWVNISQAFWIGFFLRFFLCAV